MKLSNPTPPSSPSDNSSESPEALLKRSISTPDPQLAFDQNGVNPNSILNMSHTLPQTTIKQEPGIQQYTGYDQHGYVTNMDHADYRNNPCVKPPFSYATLICMAMRESKRQKITLSGIYKWITDNFVYYQVAEPSWQVRKCIQLHKNELFQWQTTMQMHV